MSWFKRQENEIESTAEKRVRTEGLWIKCEGCGQVIWKADLDANLQVCPKCNRHFRFSARARIENLLEPGYKLVDTELKSTDLDSRLSALRAQSGDVTAKQQLAELKAASAAKKASLKTM